MKRWKFFCVCLGLFAMFIMCFATVGVVDAATSFQAKSKSVVKTTCVSNCDGCDKKVICKDEKCYVPVLPMVKKKTVTKTVIVANKVIRRGVFTSLRFRIASRWQERRQRPRGLFTRRSCCH